MSEFITMGEPLVVFCSTQPDLSIDKATNFDKVVGGAELNVATGVRRLGHTVSYVGQVGADPQGKFISEEINRMHIETKYVFKDKNHLTGYQMKQLVSKGDPFVFNFRKDSAASHFQAERINRLDLKNVRFGHLTGIFPAISDDAWQSSLALIRKMNEHKINITFDPNLRPSLWHNETEMIKKINYLASFANIVLPGQKEGQILTGQNDPEKICDFYLTNEKTKAVFVKVGAKGSFVKTKQDQHGHLIPGFKAKKVVDTVGAGDGFALGVITALLEGKNYQQAAKRGNAIGCLQVQTHGDNDGYPTREQLSDFYREMDGEENDFK